MSNRLSRRSFLQLTAVTSLGVTLAACVPASPAPASEGSAASGAEKAQVRFHCRVGVQGDYYQEMADQFNEGSDEYEIAVESFPGTNPEYLQKIATMISGGTVGDAMWAASIHNYYNYAAADLYAALDPFIQADDYDLNVFYPVAVDACTFEGQMYGLPWIVHPGRQGLFYNKTAFEEAGLDEPNADWTYEDLISAAKTLTVADGDQITQWGFLPETDYFGLVIPIRSYGGDWINAEGTECTVNSEEAVAGLKVWEQIFQDDAVSPTPGQVEDRAQMWASGRLMMVQSGYWGQSWGKNYVKDFEWMCTAMPQGPAGSQGMFEFDPNVILAKSEVQQGAWEYLKHCSTKEAGVRIAEMGSVPGGRPDVWEDERLASYPPHAAFAEMMATIAPLVLPDNFRYEEMFQAAQNILDPVWLGDASIDETIDPLTESIQAILEMPRI